MDMTSFGPNTQLRAGWLLTAGLCLTACNQESGPAPDIHDRKYVAVDVSGAELDSLPASWPCVLDRFTGLTWEVKSGQPGLHHWRNTYSWFEPDESNDELDYRGMPDAGSCLGSACDTHAFAAAVNAAGLCGFSDWRVPSRDELASINDLRKAASPPTANMDYFPFMQADEYWSANDYSFRWDAAWVWNFEHGLDRVEWKAAPRFVRLVRGEAQQLTRVKD